jgi:RimJ/RimL family protein N-acetyltransferase
MITETLRLIVREMDMSDLDFVVAMLTDPEVMRFWPRPYTREEAAEWIRRQRERYERDGCGYWLLEEKSSGTPAGQAGVVMTDVEGTEMPGLGWIVHRPFWRRGYATEAAARCRSYAFDVLGCDRVIALVRPENEPSLGVARKLGMRERRRVDYKGLEHIVFSSSRGESESPSEAEARNAL